MGDHGWCSTDKMRLAEWASQMVFCMETSFSLFRHHLIAQHRAPECCDQILTEEKSGVVTFCAAEANVNYRVLACVALSQSKGYGIKYR